MSGLNSAGHSEDAPGSNGRRERWLSELAGAAGGGVVRGDRRARASRPRRGRVPVTGLPGPVALATGKNSPMDGLSPRSLACRPSDLES